MRSGAHGRHEQFVPTGAGAHREGGACPRMGKRDAFLMQGRAYMERPYVSETYDRFHFWNAIPWSLLSFFSKEEWKVAKEEVAGQAKKDLSAGRPAAQFVIPLHLKCGLYEGRQLCRDSTNCKTRQAAPPAAALRSRTGPFS